MNIAQIIFRIVMFHRRYLHGQVHLRIAACAILAGIFSSPNLAAATTVRMETTLGDIYIELYETQAPITVANFLSYADSGRYTTNGFIHRSVPGFIIQGGGYTYSADNSSGTTTYAFTHILQDSPIQNEFSPLRSNIRGTIAMAKLGGNPNSATSEWFFNLADNSANLDYQNGGFTVFGHVIAGMNVVDAISNLKVWDASSFASAFGDLPLVNYVPPNRLDPPSNLVLLTHISRVASSGTLPGTMTTFFTEASMTFSFASTIDKTTTASLLATFTQPSNKTILFHKDGILTFTMTGLVGQTGHMVTLLNDNGSTSTHYYAYGPTPDNSVAHWYDFTFNKETGAEFVNGKILLHFVDGKRGDDDLTVNGSVTHTGISALAMDSPTTQSSSQAGGCTITTTPSKAAGNGDWIVIAMFLAFVALVRRRTRMH